MFNTHHVVSVETITGLPDPDDMPFAELALTAGVSIEIVPKNTYYWWQNKGEQMSQVQADEILARIY